MSGYQKVYLRVAGLVGDTTSDEDEMPDRVLATGSGLLSPSLPENSGDIAEGPDGLEEIVIPDQVPFTIVDGMLTHGDKPYVWLPVPSSRWMWRIEFSRVLIGGRSWQLGSFSFPLLPATQAQIDDPAYPGVNLAYYAIGSWSPGEVEALSRRMGDLEMAILATQRDAASATAARYAAEAAARAAADAAGTAPPPTWQERFYGPDLPPGWALALDLMDPPTPFVPPGVSDVAVHMPQMGDRFELALDFVPFDIGDGAGIMVLIFDSAWDGVSDDGRVFLNTASDGQGGRAVQLGNSVSATIPRYERLTLVRNGDLWSVRADGHDLMRHDGGLMTHVTNMSADFTSSLVVFGPTTVVQATYREIS